MEKTSCTLEPIMLVGITARTTNAAESFPETAQIGPIVARYFGEALGTKIMHLKAGERRIFCAYTHYESDASGAYTFFMGEEVTSFEGQPADFEFLTIPAQKYVKFTTPKGPMPLVVIDAWQRIWAMDAKTLGGKRAYKTDFELYDARSADPQNMVLDLYIGVEA